MAISTLLLRRCEFSQGWWKERSCGRHGQRPGVHIASCLVIMTRYNAMIKYNTLPSPHLIHWTGWFSYGGSHIAKGTLFRYLHSFQEGLGKSEHCRRRDRNMNISNLCKFYNSSKARLMQGRQCGSAYCYEHAKKLWDLL